ncbi:MAG: dicarboxylate/amino acid:cation symporter [Erysipelotrichaceae bacterium]
MIKSREEVFKLSTKTIDEVSTICVQTLEELNTDKKDIIRIRLSLEEILGNWLESLEGALVQVNCGKKFGRAFLKISVEGPFMDTWQKDNEAYLISNRILCQAGLSFTYIYKNGKNCLICNPKKKTAMGSIYMLFSAAVMAFVLGYIVRLHPQTQKLMLEITQPLFDMMLGALRAVSSPLIFLAVCCGILNIGDLSEVGKIGRKLIIKMIFGMFAVSALMAFVSCLLFPVVMEKGEAISGNLSGIFQMILGVVPSDIVSPFQSGNALQLVFLGICVGLTLLILKERTSALQNILMQTNEAIQFMMSELGKIIPLFVFLSLFNLMLSDFDSGFLSLFKVFTIAVPGSLVLALFYVINAAFRLSTNPILMMKKMLPTYLIALTTASSAAALATNLETCVKELGIPKKVADFSIPLGQVIYKPGFVVGLFATVMCLSEYYEISITPQFIIMTVLVVGLLSMASPPIPGGALSVITVLFAQLSIPAEAIALAVAVNVVLDFFMTSSGLACLQVQVTLVADSVGVLDKKRLQSTN